MADTLSIVIPALDAAATLPGTLAALDRPAPFDREVIVADGGSADATALVARRHGVTLIAAPRGRGAQLAAGAAAASGAWLLFLHADTILAADWPDCAARFMARPGSTGRAAAFRFALDDASAAARRIETGADWRCRRLGLAYGDQGLLMSRALYDRLGGFRPLPLMEDVDLVRRIGRARLVLLDCRAVTSAERYRRGGYGWRVARNLGCLALYFIGLPPRLIARLYG